MNNHVLQEITIAILLGILLLLFTDPFMLWMPNMLEMIISGGLVVVFSIFAVFLWREKPRDEREELHRMMADRLAFLAGSGALVLGIAVQTIRHEKDLWLIIALAIMILVKIIGLMWARKQS